MKDVTIKKAVPEDALILAKIQNESFKSAFTDLLDESIIEECTKLSPAIAMYEELLDAGIGHGYILTLDQIPHAIAWWDRARDEDMGDFCELICIHSLKENQHMGYGSLLLKQVLSDMKNTGFTKVYLWVFSENHKAISFYEKHGFRKTGRTQPSFNTQESMMIKSL